MLNTIAAGTDGTPTASNAGAAAIDLAERNGARLALTSSYRNDRNDRLTSKQADAPLEIQWALNPGGEAETILTQAADEAEARSLQVTKLARFGDPAEVLCELAAEQRADVLVVGNKGMHRRLLRQRSQQRRPQGALLGPDRQDLGSRSRLASAAIANGAKRSHCRRRGTRPLRTSSERGD